MDQRTPPVAIGHNAGAPCVFDRSKALIDHARSLMPGGVSSHFRMNVSPTPLVFERADGARLIDADGNSLIDYYMALGPIILGHTPPDVIAAARAQMERGLLYGGQSELEFEAARRVCAMVPCAERVRFAASGTEIVQLALRLVRAHTGRSKILRFEGHYHGWADNILWSNAPALDSAGPEDAPEAVPGSAGQDPLAGANVVVLSWNRPELVAERLKQGDVAAVIMEPAMCNVGGVWPLPGYLEAVREACTASGTVLIFDEVVTGFRIAAGGAQQRFGVTPDLATFAKAIANGFQVAALTGRADIMDELAGGAIVHGGTYNAQAVAMAATVATLTRLSTPGFYETLEARGARLMHGIDEAFKSAGVPAVVSGFPQIFNVALGLTEAPINYRGTLGVDRARYVRLTHALLQRGVRALERGAWFLCSEHDDATIDETLDALKEALPTIA